MSEVTFTAINPLELAPIAEKIFQQFPAKRVFALSGEMGAGKTTFIKVFCTQLGVIDNVASPTYAIIYEYKVVTSSPNGESSGKQEGKVFHIDAYRLNSEKEARAIGLDEILTSGNYCFIEWPGNIVSLLPDDVLSIDIKVTDNGERKITVSG